MKSELYPSPYLEDAQVSENTFLNKTPEAAEIPTWESALDRLPRPVWDGHEDSLRAWEHAWRIAFANLHNPTEENGFVSPYLDAAFNNDLFLWDSCFMLMFGIYADAVFPFQKTLDNFYAAQLPDGFISRQLHENNGQAKWMRFDPVSTGPNLPGWCEWEYYQRTGNRDRLEKVYPALSAYHRWLRRNRTWQDGTYWSSGWGSGMDNQPRLPAEAGINRHQQEAEHHGWMSWIDTNFQQVLSCNMLLAIAEELGQDSNRAELAEERDALIRIINETMWSEEEGFYFDRYRDGSLASAKTIGAYWGLLADAVPPERAECMIRHLTDPRTFGAPHPVPTLSRDSEGYEEDGGYWRGGVWAPTNYMVLRGLTRKGRNDLAVSLGRRHYDCMLQVWRDTGTFWENYAPESCARGGRARPEFIGWTGLTPITVLIEYVLGIQMDVPNNTIHWYISNTERHGVENLRFGDREISLICDARASSEDAPVIHTKNCEGIRVIPHPVRLQEVQPE